MEHSLKGSFAQRKESDIKLRNFTQSRKDERGREKGNWTIELNRTILLPALGRSNRGKGGHKDCRLCLPGRQDLRVATSQGRKEEDNAYP